ncbi:hypothetical protein [Nocardiopsis coralliicola]
MQNVKRILTATAWTVFWASLALFLGLGTIVMAGQFAGVAAFQPAWVEALAGLPSEAAFTCAAICASAAFALQYTSRFSGAAASEDD